MPGDAVRPSNNPLTHPAVRQLVLLPVIFFLALFSPGVRVFWRWVLHAYVEEYDSYGMQLLSEFAVEVVSALAVWVVCWFLLRRRRALLIGQLLVVLAVPIAASAWSIDEARWHPAAEHDAQVARQAAADHAAALGAVAYWKDLPAWLGRLPAGSRPWFPPVPQGHAITWRGAAFPATGPTPGVNGPFRDRQVVVVSGSPAHLLVLTAHQANLAGVLDLVDLPSRGSGTVVAAGVTGAAAAPAGNGFAYSTDRAVTAQLDGAARPVVLPRPGLVLRGWGSDGVVLQRSDGTLLRWRPDRPEQAPITLAISSGAVQVPCAGTGCSSGPACSRTTPSASPPAGSPNPTWASTAGCGR